MALIEWVNFRWKALNCGRIRIILLTSFHITCGCFFLSQQRADGQLSTNMGQWQEQLNNALPNLILEVRNWDQHQK